jgi:hypothetical protein
MDSVYLIRPTSTLPLSEVIETPGAILGERRQPWFTNYAHGQPRLKTYPVLMRPTHDAYLRSGDKSVPRR